MESVQRSSGQNRSAGILLSVGLALTTVLAISPSVSSAAGQVAGGVCPKAGLKATINRVPFACVKNAKTKKLTWTKSAAPVAANTPAPAAAPAAPAGPAEKLPSMTPVSLRLDWTWLPNHIAFGLGKEKGIYAKYNIDLTIKEGKGSGSSILLAHNGNDDFAFASTSALFVNRSKGLDVQNVLLVQRQSSIATVCYKTVNFKKAKDLEGHSILMATGSDAANVWPALLKANNVDATKIDVQMASSSTYFALFQAGKADCYNGQFGNDTLRASLLDPKIGAAVKWADMGVPGLGHGIVANATNVKENPALMKAFVAATIEAWTYTCANTTEGQDWYIKNFPQNNADDFWKNYTRLSLPIECEKMQPLGLDDGQVLGTTSDAYINKVVQFLKDNNAITDDIKGAFLYRTNAFIPVKK